MLLHKTLSLSDVRLTKASGTTGRFSGYASVFGGVDSYGDTIIKGAFESTLRTHGKPKMFFDHVWDLPVARIDVAKEDDHGLYIEWEMTPGLSKAADIQAALDHGTLDGLSIGGFIKKGDYEETEGGRVIRKWTKLLEVSVVAFPADAAARVEMTKGADILEAIQEAATVREIEQLLRDAAGLSKGAAEALVARIKSVAFAGEPRTAADPMLTLLADRLHALAQR
jgi:hypothetical protein